MNLQSVRLVKWQLQTDFRSLQGFPLPVDGLVAECDRNPLIKTICNNLY